MKDENTDGADAIQMSAKSKKVLVVLAFVIFSLSLISAFYFFMTPGQTVNITFAYVVGLSMILLPCTLPLAFVIVPLAMGKKPAKGLLMSIYFGLGLAITLSIYGFFVALVGKSIGLDQAVSSAKTTSRVLFIIGGLAAFIFGLSELKLIKFSLPSYKGSYPDFIQKQGDYLKAFFLGLFLGNAGVGCPNPLFYVLLGDIAVTGSVATGWWLGFIHGVGRATPLIFLTILGILGVNAVGDIAKKTASVTKWTGISLVILGAFIFTIGTSHQWYEQSVVHKGWNQAIELVTGGQSSVIVEKGALNTQPENNTENADHGDSPDYIPAPWSWITLLLMSVLPIVWYKYKQKRSK